MSDTAHNGRTSPVRARTLEYKQAMKDFHTMFPTLEKNIIECVLRANSGHVDSTIDQLLQLTQDNMSQDGRSIRSFERLYHTYDDSTDSSGSMSSELRDRLSSSDEDRLPPKYTPYFEPPPSAYTFSTQPVEPVTTKTRLSQHPTSEPKRYRDWNPPLLGALPPDFLRIIPVQNHNKYKKHSSSSNHSYASRHSSSRSHQPSSRRTMSNHSTDRSSQDTHSSQHRPLQRRRTTGEVNVTLSRTSNSSSQAQQRMVMVNSPRERSSLQQRHHQQTSSPNSSARQRSSEEESQYVEDRKFALLLQNEEFLKELRRNEQFLHELNGGNVPEDSVVRPTYSNPRHEFRPIHVDPLSEVPTSQTDQCPVPSSQGHQEDKNFKESLKHMNKSARRSFNEIARRFTSRRKSYKSMSNTVDPIFADCREDGR